MSIQLKRETRRFIESFVADEIAAMPFASPADPFAIETDCSNPAGHYPMRDRGSIVCPHCSKVLWS